MDTVEVTGLSRVYRRGRRHRDQQDVLALDRVDLRIPTAEVHGLLGPNGAGKTTLCKILSTILTPTAGTARVCGWDVVRQADEVRRCVGLVLGGDRGLYSALTARANLQFWAAMYAIPRNRTEQRIDEVISQVGLQDVDQRVEQYSRGMKQRLHLARGLLPEPRVLILDEPTIGMDPVSAKAFRDLVRTVASSGATILLATHDMAEAEELCGRVSLIDHGRILATESPARLAAMISAYERIDVADLSPAVAAQVADRFSGRVELASAAVQPDGTVRLQTCREGATATVLTELLSLGHTAIRVGRPSLAEVYVHVIGDRGMRVR